MSYRRALLSEIESLEAMSVPRAPPPPARGRSIREADRVGVIFAATPTPTLPLSGGGSAPSLRLRSPIMLTRTLFPSWVRSARPQAMNRTGLVSALLVGAVVGVVFALYPQLDIAISRLFFNEPHRVFPV